MAVHKGGRGPRHLARGVGAYTPPSPAAPSNLSAPVISGIQTQGQTLTVSNGSWSGFPPPSFTYQWKRAGSAIGGATSQTYVIQAADVGQAITCTVTATNASGSASATSASVTPAATLTISGTPGTTATVGSAYSFTPSTGGGHTPKTFSIVNQPAWAAFSTSTGQLTGTPTGVETDSGIVISVTDADGLTAALPSFTITVSAAGSTTGQSFGLLLAITKAS